MITDLFSHKIHSSSKEWPDKLVEIAALFAEFDGKIYDRDAVANRLSEISPRSAYAVHDVIRDVSKFRDEIGAYPAYLGVYHVTQSEDGWRLMLGETARRFLVCEEPDIGAFLRLQLSLFQYPNAMGAQLYARTNRLRVQGNARKRTLEFIRDGYHLSPLRLVAAALWADSALRGCSIFEAGVTYPEIFALANDRRVFRFASPPRTSVRKVLREIRRGRVHPPAKFERRLHLLNHLELFSVGKRGIRVRPTVCDSDRESVQEKLRVISQIKSEYRTLDGVTNGNELAESIAGGSWWEYFDGVRTLAPGVIAALATDRPLDEARPPVVQEIGPVAGQPEAYRLRERPEELPPPSPPVSRQAELADPEVTRIKRQRRTLAHKSLVSNMADRLRTKRARPMDNAHIDLYARVPSDGTFLFEMKSGGENLLDQVRKGISQLYEYRYRYRAQIGDQVNLCLVLTKRPTEIPWIEDYVCTDRGINLCWFDDQGHIQFPDPCRGTLQHLL